jgi:acetylornithine deacetylase/succinyl-diaminopimelate desuccinylase family protein
MDPNPTLPGQIAPIDPARLELLLKRLVAIDSTNPPGAESSVVAELAGHLRRHGIHVDIEYVLPGRPNLTAVIGRGTGRTLLLNAHTDTMPAGPGWSVPPLSALVEGGILYGRGACDAKGGLAAAAEAMVALAEAHVDLQGRVVLDAVIDEEAGASGTKAALASGRRADWAIVAEPTDLVIARVSNGQLDVALTVHGMAAHGSTPDDGRSAIADAAALVAEFEAAHERLRPFPHPIVGPASFSVGTIQGGIQASIVASECHIEVDHRILPGSSVEAATAEVDAVIETVRAARPGLEVTRRVTVAIEPVETAADSPVCVALKAALEGTGARAVIGGLRATSDAAWLAAAGIPTVVFGPGRLADAHRPDEQVVLADVEMAARALVATIVALVR